MAALDHVTALVENAEAASHALEQVLGVAPSGEAALPGMSIRTFRIGEVEIHVNAPAGPGPVRDFIERHGPGVHHVAVRVACLDETLRALEAAGLPALGEPTTLVDGALREVFLDPAHTGGLMIQLVERRGEIAPAMLDGEGVTKIATIPPPAR